MNAAAAKYGRIFNVGLQNTVIYRGNFILRALFGVVPLVATVFLWRAVFDANGGGERGGYTLPAAVNYFLLVILAESLITPTEDEWQIATDIRDGHLNALLSKPLNYFAYRTCLFASSRVASTVITLPITAALFWWFGSFDHLPGLGTCLLSAWSLLMAALIQFFIAYALALLAFWILEISTVVFILYSFEYFLSGQLFPLDLAPPGVRAVLEWLPFPYELFFPVSVFLEKTQGEALWRGLAIQAGWVIVTWAVGQILWVRGLRRYGAVGG